MKKPQTLEEFKTLIKSMKHRERFVFDSSNNVEIEIYHTIKFETIHSDRNICVQIINPDGTSTTSNKLLKLFDDYIFSKLYNRIT